MILNYKMFNSNEEFVKWQKEKGRDVRQVSPIIGNLNINMAVEETSCSRAQSEGSMDSHISVFVLYVEIEE